MTVIPLTKWAFFVEAATTREVLDMLKKSDLREGSKYDKRYPGVIPCIIGTLEEYVNEEDPGKKYWRDIVTLIKKENDTKKELDKLQDKLWEAKKQDDVVAIEAAQVAYDTVLRRHNEIGKEVPFITSILGVGTAGLIEAFLDDFPLFDRYNFKPDFSSLSSFVSGVQSEQPLIEEREAYRALKESVSPDSWQGGIVYDFKNGWAIWRLEELEDLHLESQIAGHCIGQEEHPHCFNIESGRTAGFSLRDKNGVPWATIELTTDMNNIFQVQGRHNQDVLPEHQKMIAEWLANSTDVGSDHPYITEKPEGQRTGLYSAYDNYPKERYPTEERERVEGNEVFFVFGAHFIEFGEVIIDMIDEAQKLNREYDVGFVGFLDYLKEFEFIDFEENVTAHYAPYSVDYMREAPDRLIEMFNDYPLNELDPYDAVSIAMSIAMLRLSYKELPISKTIPEMYLLSSWADKILTVFSNVRLSKFPIHYDALIARAGINLDDLNTISSSSQFDKIAQSVVNNLIESIEGRLWSDSPKGSVEVMRLLEVIGNSLNDLTSVPSDKFSDGEDFQEKVTMVVDEAYRLREEIETALIDPRIWDDGRETQLGIEYGRKAKELLLTLKEEVMTELWGMFPDVREGIDRFNKMLESRGVSRWEREWLFP